MDTHEDPHRRNASLMFAKGYAEVTAHEMTIGHRMDEAFALRQTPVQVAKILHEPLGLVEEWFGRFTSNVLGVLPTGC